MREGGAWALTSHSCRHCLGRILQDGDEFLCSVCERTGRQSVDQICACGIRPRNGRPELRAFQCVANPAPTETSPARVVVRFNLESDAGLNSE